MTRRLSSGLIDSQVLSTPSHIEAAHSATVFPLTVTVSCPVSLSPVTATLKLWLLNTPPRPNSTVELVSVHPPPRAPSDCPGTPALKPPPTESRFQSILATYSPGNYLATVGEEETEKGKHTG